MNRGIAVAMAANVVWGLAPIYWRLVDDVPAGDIVLFRILATALFLLGLHLARRSLRSLDRVRRTPGVTRAMALSGALVAANWLGFVYAVTNERVLEASLGYFMNPLVSVALGVMILGERLRPVQTTALLLAVVGVVVLTIDVGRPPWISFLLAGSFGLYGLIRKTAAIESLDGLSLEVAMLAPVALVVMIARAAGGDGVLGWSVPWRDLWLLGAGVLTATPLLMFAYAARRIPLSLLGILQYTVPTLQFLLGVLVYDETWTGGQAIGYCIVWAGLLLLAADGVRAGIGLRSRDGVLGIQR